MASEIGRRRARKNIIIGEGAGDYVSLPVITEISFIDKNDRYQEWIYSVNNSYHGDREVHIDTVYGIDQDGNRDISQSILVERVDVWKLIDPHDRYQERNIVFDNRTGGDLDPPHFSTHLKTHVVRYLNSADPSNIRWLDSELIDQFDTIDPHGRYQQKTHTLVHDDIQADPAWAEISDSANGIDPPWRTDPFQNIIAFGTQTGGSSCGLTNYSFAWPGEQFTYYIHGIAIYWGPGPLTATISIGNPGGAPPTNYTTSGTGMIALIVVRPPLEGETGYESKINTDWNAFWSQWTAHESSLGSHYADASMMLEAMYSALSFIVSDPGSIENHFDIQFQSQCPIPTSLNPVTG